MIDSASRDPAASAGTPSPDAVRAAFRELHGPRLHGFALLLTLGDRPQAASLAAEALAAGCLEVDRLRHPERAAAWLRRRVLLCVDPPRSQARRPVVDDVGAGETVVAALATLPLAARAAIIAATVERLDRRDVGTIVGSDGAALDRLIRRSRTRYADAYAELLPEASEDGPIVDHIQQLARAALG